MQITQLNNRMDPRAQGTTEWHLSHRKRRTLEQIVEKLKFPRPLSHIFKNFEKTSGRVCMGELKGKLDLVSPTLAPRYQAYLVKATSLPQYGRTDSLFRKALTAYFVHTYIT